MNGRGMIEQFFLDRVPVEPGDRAQPPRNGGPGPASCFQFAGEALDIRAASTEQAQVMLVAPAGELAQIQLIRLPGQAAVTSQEAS
jgi:hypothetical protein